MAQRAARGVINAIPNREIHAVLAFHRESLVQRGEHGGGVAKISIRQRARADQVDGGYREQRCGDAMPADIEQVNGEMLFIDPVVTKRIAADFAGGVVFPIDLEGLFDRFGKNRADIARGFGEFALQAPLGFLDRLQVNLLHLCFRRQFNRFQKMHNNLFTVTETKMVIGLCNRLFVRLGILICGRTITEPMHL